MYRQNGKNEGDGTDSECAWLEEHIEQPARLRGQEERREPEPLNECRAVGVRDTNLNDGRMLLLLLMLLQLSMND